MQMLNAETVCSILDRRIMFSKMAISATTKVVMYVVYPMAIRSELPTQRKWFVPAGISVRFGLLRTWQAARGSPKGKTK